MGTKFENLSPKKKNHFCIQLFMTDQFGKIFAILPFKLTANSQVQKFKILVYNRFLYSIAFN